MDKNCPNYAKLRNCQRYLRGSEKVCRVCAREYAERKGGWQPSPYDELGASAPNKGGGYKETRDGIRKGVLQTQPIDK